MMFTRQIMMLTLSAVITGCAGNVQKDAMGCEVVKQTVCDDKGKSPSVEISKRWFSDRFKFKPECIVAERGALIIVELNLSRKSAGDSVITPHNPADGWLAGTNSANSEFIVIEVPNVDSGDYKYNFKKDGVCADPRVHVK